jgi:hypothetical protein
MTPEEAMERLAAGGYVLCNDVPPATEFGCDIMTWNGACATVRTHSARVVSACDAWWAGVRPTQWATSSRASR